MLPLHVYGNGPTQFSACRVIPADSQLRADILLHYELPQGEYIHAAAAFATLHPAAAAAALRDPKEAAVVNARASIPGKAALGQLLALQAAICADDVAAVLTETGHLKPLDDAAAAPELLPVADIGIDGEAQRAQQSLGLPALPSSHSAAHVQSGDKAAAVGSRTFANASDSSEGAALSQLTFRGRSIPIVSELQEPDRSGRGSEVKGLDHPAELSVGSLQSGICRSPMPPEEPIDRIVISAAVADAADACQDREAVLIKSIQQANGGDGQTGQQSCQARASQEAMSSAAAASVNPALLVPEKEVSGSVTGATVAAAQARMQAQGPVAAAHSSLLPHTAFPRESPLKASREAGRPEVGQLVHSQKQQQQQQLAIFAARQPTAKASRPGQDGAQEVCSASALTAQTAKTGSTHVNDRRGQAGRFRSEALQLMGLLLDKGSAHDAGKAADAESHATSEFLISQVPGMYSVCSLTT